ncbi:MAG: hypothetical protein WCD35_09840 [Mycobacteriales bacterium]
MIRARRRLAAGALLVGIGWVLSPQPVPVYDGIGTPDEPYRYVSAPAGAKPTAAATTARAQTPVQRGLNSNGLNVQTAEQGPQLSLFVPPGALRSPGRSQTVEAVPQAPTDQPAGARVDGNVYLVTVTDPAGPVTTTAQAALATIYLRATTAAQPGPVMEYRATTGQPWKEQKTARGGQDVYVASFVGPGQYALAFQVGHGSSGGGRSPLPFLLLGGVVLLVVVVVVIRLRAAQE